MQIDEAAFTGKRFHKKTFQGPRSPYKQAQRFANVRYVAASLAISHSNGFLGYIIPKEGGVKGHHFTRFVRQLIYKYGGH